MAGTEVFLSSKALREVNQALTDRSFFGVPRYTTALLPSTPGEGALAFDTTTDTFKGFNGTVWGALGGGSGDVTGPGSSTLDHIVTFSDTSGKVIKDASNITAIGGAIYSDPGFLLSLLALAPAQIATTQAGSSVAAEASAAVVGSSINGAADGGSIFLTTGAASRLVSGNANGGDVTITCSPGIGTGLRGNVTINDNAGLNLGQTNNTTRPLIQWNTTQTVDTGMFLTGSTSNHWVIAERADNEFDFAHAAVTDPTLFIHSAAQSTTQWGSLNHDGSNFRLNAGAGTNMRIIPNLLIDGYLTTTSQAASGAYVILPHMSNQTPDTGGLLTGTTANSIIIAEYGDAVSFDFAHPLATNPTLFIHSRNASTTEFVGIAHNGGGAVINNQGTVTLTEAGGAETVMTLTTATGQMSGGKINYTVRATDATDLVARSGSFDFVCVNAATVVTATLGASAETNDGSVVIATGGATLTYAITADVATANQLKIAFNIDSSLAVSTASITYTVILNGPGTVS